jgi:hypothetical protein
MGRKALRSRGDPSDERGPNPEPVGRLAGSSRAGRAVLMAGTNPLGTSEVHRSASALVAGEFEAGFTTIRTAPFVELV